MKPIRDRDTPLPKMKRVLLGCALAACASGRANDQSDASSHGADAKVYLDAPAVVTDGSIDAHIIPPDAPPDAYQCHVMTHQLLMNPVFDLNPSGMGWVQQNIDNAYPIVTGDDGIAEQSPPFKAWMGGFAGDDVGVATASDMLYQDIAVPPSTTQLAITGYYEVRTGETGSTVYDSAQLAITQTNGTPIETVKSWTNAAPTTAWTAFSYNVAANLSGQTVRVRFTTSNDYSNATSFYFDTFSVTATYCQ